MVRPKPDPHGTAPPPPNSDGEINQAAVKKVAEIIDAPEGFEDKKKDPTKK